VIFGFGKKGTQDDDSDEPEEDVDYVLFRGALNGQDANLSENARLAEVGLLPAKEIVTDALLRRAEAFRIDPKGNLSVVTLYIDGVAYPGGRLSRQQALAVTQMIKLLAGLDIKERRKPQSGGIKAELNDVKYELRVDTAATEVGVERLSVRATDVKKILETPESIGIPEFLKQRIREYTSHKQGVIIACGPKKSGTTTTAIGIIKSVDAYLYTIYNLADLGGRELAHVTNFEWDAGDDLETTMGRCLRVEADVMFVGPIRDADAAKTVFSFHSKVALIGEMAAPDAATAVVLLAKWVEDPKVAAEALNLVITQKLIRLVCMHCRQAFRPNPKLVEKVGLPPETRVLYRATQWKETPPDGVEQFDPCPKCGGIGYLGRTAMFEVIDFTDGMRDVVSQKPSADAIRAQARKEKMPTIRAEGLRLVAEGKTTLEELQRVLKPT
jgi:type IV pilus assembly protein PilB